MGTNFMIVYYSLSFVPQYEMIVVQVDQIALDHFLSRYFDLT
jgi:hypothetical protein